MWFNPPFSVLSKVIGKISSDSSRGILLVPKWTSASWWEDLQCITLNYWDFPEAFHFLKENGGVVSSSSPIRVCVVDGSLATNDNLCVILTNEEPFRSCPTKAPPVVGSVIEARDDELASHPFVQSALSSISKEFASVFSPIPAGVPPIRCHSGVHTVDLQPGSVPKCKCPYRRRFL